MRTFSLHAGLPMFFLALFVAPALAHPAHAPSNTEHTNLPTSTGGREPFSGQPTTTGALKNPPEGVTSTIPALPPNPTATYYNPLGKLLREQPAAFVPHGGLNTNGTQPRYMVESDFDFQSLALGTYQEYIELDLFSYGVAAFSAEEFAAAGLNEEDRALLLFMAQQEVGHAKLLSNMLGPAAPKRCHYNYPPFANVREYIDFNQKLTRWGESGVLGFLEHMDSRDAAQLLLQSITVESRQQMVFRQMLGLHAMPVWFQPGIPQSWQWSLLAPYIAWCPANQTRLAWQNIPELHVLNQPNPNRIDAANYSGPPDLIGNRTSDPSSASLPADQSCVNSTELGVNCRAAITRVRHKPLSFAGRRVELEWESPGRAVGPNNSYVTTTQTTAEPRFAAWVSQLNLTYTPLTTTGSNTGFTYQPSEQVFEGDPAVNGTMFLALTDTDLFLTPSNLSMINPHVVALGVYQAG